MRIMQSALLQEKLLEWYTRHQRQMPWRGETDPYKIWVSEVMLQQTQVVTVIPYYERFILRFPNVDSLAQASIDEVLKMWEGLGYYARARNMHKAAKQIASENNEQIPRRYETLKRLPGFGEYTAGAVASIAFNEPVAAIDGNVKRVISRIFAIEDDITSKPGRDKIKAAATALAQTAPEPSQWTQALMELGATVCTPARPKCLLCPLGRELCKAQQLGLAESLPIKPRKKPIPHYNVAAGVIYKDSNRTAFLIAQRPANGMLGGLWEFPGGKQEPGENLQQCLQREILEELAIKINVAEPITVVKHAFTHFKITLHAFAATLISGTPQKIGAADWRWVTLADLDRFAFGRADRKVIAALQHQQIKPALID